jgi:hypothetical protein
MLESTISALILTIINNNKDGSNLKV